jgi:glutathione S-transferase
LILLKVKAYKFCIVQSFSHFLLVSGEHKKEEYKKINPFQKVPVIDHDGFLLTERYLNENDA